MKAAGIDPGTGSMDLFGFEDKTDEILMELAIPRSEVTKNPKIVLDAIKENGVEFDAIVGPSGYGLPLMKASLASVEQIKSATFVSDADLKRRLNIVGLRELMLLMRSSDMNIWFTPGVIHLLTVPEYRKINRIDLGTADKVFSAAAAIRDQADRLNLPYNKTSFILIEVGFGYTAALAVDSGRIVDGVGGTVGGLGYMSLGGIDGELAYAIANVGEFSKTMLFTGGAASVAGIDPKKTTIEKFFSMIHESDKAKLAYDAFRESIFKDALLMLSSVKKPREIILSGRFARISSFTEDIAGFLCDNLKSFNRRIRVKTINRRGSVVKEAAEGAAVIASGIAGGKYAELVENMRIPESSGGVFSHLYLPEETKEKIVDEFTRR